MTDSAGDKPKKLPWPDLPSALQHDISMRWLTLESLRILQERLSARHDNIRVRLLTSAGIVEGMISDISENYEYAMGQGLSDVDVASATVHIRTDLWNMYGSRDKHLKPNDSAAVLHMTHVTIQAHGQVFNMDEFAIFVGEIAGFGLISPTNVWSST